RPAASREWPPPVRAVETEGDNLERLQAFGSLLDQLAERDLQDFSAALCEAPLRDELRTVMAQLGAARLMRLLHWLAEIDLPGCAVITQAGVNGLNARIQADDSNINAPQSVTSLTCLDNFFNGVGLNLVTNLLNPANQLQAVEGKICNLVQQSWNSLLGKVQCGLTITGFNLGFGGLGGGLSCPKLSFGGGGPPIATIGIGTGSTGSGLYINGTGTAPTGYSLPNVPQGTF